jgi:hypothetical protein
VTPARVALAAILAGGLAVRLYGLRHGLPFIHHSDESQHFTNVAVEMFDGDYNPHYFQNPSAFTYLVHLALRVQFGGEEIVREYARDPSAIYETARLVAVALCMLGVAAVYAVGRRLWGAMEGLVAAAVLAFAFLPVAYSRYALTDVGVLLPVAVTIYGIVRIHEDGARRYFVIAGLGLGFTIGFKYTAGLILVPLLVAVALRARQERDPVPEMLAGAVVVVVAAVAAFLLTTPYFLLDLGEAIDQLQDQREVASDAKIGQASENPYGFYVSSLTWALGWGAALAALAGFLWQLRRDRTRALLLGLFPVLLYIYLGTDAERYFARWLLPAYPILALFAGVAVAGVARSVSRAPRVQAAVLAALALALVAQPLVADLRTGALLRKDDTREIAREYMLERLPAGTRMVVEPSIRRAYDLPLLGVLHREGDPRFRKRFGAPPKVKRDDLPAPGRTTRFIEDLEPGRIDRYRAAGHCVVVTYEWTRERARISGLDEGVAYFDRLERESTVIFRADPYDDGEGPVEFDFDQSTHLYHPPEFERPGPEVVIYRLDRCGGEGPTSTAAG